MDSQKHLRDLAVSDSGFVFDPYSGSSFTANGTALVIIEELREGSTRADILERLSAEYDVAEPVDLERDLDEFVSMLRRYRILDEDFDI